MSTMERTTTNETLARGVFPSRSLLATRALSGVAALLVLLQGATAGSHLTGLDGALGLHEMVGTEIVTIVGLLTIVTAAGAVKARAWALPVAIAGFMGLGLQIGMGFGDQLQIHVPLGITLFGLYLTMALTLTSKEHTR